MACLVDTVIKSLIINNNNNNNNNQKFFGVKLPIKFKQPKLNWCTPHGENMALGVCIYKSYEHSKSLVNTCSGSLA